MGTHLGITTVTAQLNNTLPHRPDTMDLKIVLILVVIPVAVFAATETICEGKVANLRCKEGTIKIKSAMYGRQNRQSCKDSNANNINCSAGRAETKAKNKCDGKSHCKLEASNSVYGDPCPGTSKYMEVKWTCKA